jgi:hypothetical protein
MVRRVSETEPSGEWVDRSAADVAVAGFEELPTVNSGGWIMSSFDLLSGVDVSDEEVTVPGELLDQLFPPVACAPKSGSES